MNPVGILFMVLGLGVSISAGANMRWYMNLPKVRRSRTLFGDTGARVAHTIVGFLVFVMGLLFLLGVFETAR